MAVRMTHPDLPDTEIAVAPSAVPFHVEAGWSEVAGQDEHGETWPAEAQRFGGQAVVLLRHPDLPGQPEVEVAESAVPFHREKGWVVVEETEAGDLGDLTVVELQERARDAGLPVSGTKAELVERLRQAEQDQAGDQEEA